MALLAGLPRVPAVADEAVRYSAEAREQFMRKWLVLGPVYREEVSDASKARDALVEDYLAEAGGEAKVAPAAEDEVEIGGRRLVWKLAETDDDAVDLIKVLGPHEFRVAYAYGEIQADVARQIVLGLGSDDSVRVWLNGELIHDVSVGRAVQPDQDLIAANLQPGTNRLLLKVQNHLGAWGFACRILGDATLGARLVQVAAAGEVQKVDQLLELGAPIDTRNDLGLTPLLAARISGRAEMIEHLLAKGANEQIEMPPWQSLVDKILSQVANNDSPAVVMLVSHDGEVLQDARGCASLSHHVLATPHTKFRIGSVTKQFTAAAILKLQELGKLKIEDALDKYFPDFPRGSEVTLHHLLTHTSGIRSYTDKPDFLEHVTSSIEPDQLIASFQNDPYDFEPGQSWKYNNSGYFLLGRIIEKVSGQSYGEFLRTTFFEPLEMHNTGVHHWKDILPHEAMGYAWENGRWQQALNWNMSHAGGAGALYSTVEDLQRWNEGLFGGEVLSAASLEAAFTPVKLPEGANGPPYGYGWIIGEQRGLKTISHGGGLFGFSSYLVRFPEQKLTIVALVNALPSSPGLEPSQLATQVAQLVLWREMQPITTPPVDATVTGDMLAAYVGRYDYQGAVMTVVQDGNRLFAQLTGQEAYEIFPKSPTEFFWKVVDAQVTFVKSADGEVTHAIHRQSGIQFQAPKLPPQPTVTLSAEQLEKFVGRYDYGGGAILTVTREGPRLFAEMTGQPKFEIFAKSDTEFFWKVVVAEVKFVLDDDGRVAKAVHQQAGRTIEAPRIE